MRPIDLAPAARATALAMAALDRQADRARNDEPLGEISPDDAIRIFSNELWARAGLTEPPYPLPLAST